MVGCRPWMCITHPRMILLDLNFWVRTDIFMYDILYICMVCIYPILFVYWTQQSTNWHIIRTKMWYCHPTRMMLSNLSMADLIVFDLFIMNSHSSLERPRCAVFVILWILGVIARLSQPWAPVCVCQCYLQIYQMTVGRPANWNQPTQS